MVVAGHGKAAAHVRDDEVALGIGGTELGSAAKGAFLLVEAVHVALAIDTGIAGDTGNVLEFVGIGLVDSVGRLAHLLGKSLQQRRT